MVFNGQHWTNDGMVSHHRSGLDSMHHVSSDKRSSKKGQNTLALRKDCISSSDLNEEKDHTLSCPAFSVTKIITLMTVFVSCPAFSVSQ